MKDSRVVGAVTCPRVIIFVVFLIYTVILLTTKRRDEHLARTSSDSGVNNGGEVHPADFPTDLQLPEDDVLNDDVPHDAGHDTTVDDQAIDTEDEHHGEVANAEDHEAVNETLVTENEQGTPKRRKPRMHLVTFATPSYVKYATVMLQSARARASCSYNQTMYSMDDVDRTFYNQNIKILSQPKGAGYWLWKPYLIRKKLAEMHDGDVLMYVDSMYLFMTDPCKLIPSNAGHVCFERKAGQGTFKEFPYTKHDAYLLMDVKPDYQRIQPWAGFLMLRKSDTVVKFVDEWLHYCQDYRIISNDPSVLAHELPGFRGNRNDQTVLSLLLRKKHWNCRALHRGILFNIRMHGSRL